MAAHYVHSIDPFAIKFYAGCPIPGIRWYGIFYLLSFAFAICALNFFTERGKSPLSKDDNGLLLLHIVCGVLIGGRCGYALLYNFNEFAKNPLEIFALWRGGMSSHGGFIGVAVATVLFCKKKSLPILEIGDMLSVIAPIGFFLGRVANFINGELYGKVSAVKWAVLFPGSSPNQCAVVLPRHPSQLYEGFLEGLVLFLYMQLRFWRKNPQKNGQLSGEFLVLYAIFRIFTEYFREPDAQLICGLSRGQFYSFFLIFFGTLLILLAKFWKTSEDLHG